jgi:hypothetical protein
MSSASFTTLNLALQICILALLVASIGFLKRKKIRFHFNFISAAVVTNIVSFAVVMGPAWGNIGGDTGLIGVISLIHAVTGGIAFILSFILLGSWMTSTWILKAQTPKRMRCYFQRIPMWLTLLLWVTSLVLGILLYLMVNTSWFSFR